MKNLIIAAALFFSASLYPQMAAAHDLEAHSEIEAALSQIRDAALASDPASIESMLAEDMVLVSQSGTVYGKEAVLFDLSNPFDSWANSEIVIREAGEILIVTLVNERQRTGMESARFRVMQLWTKQGDGWILKAQSSALIKVRE